MFTNIIQPLRRNWKVDEDSAESPIEQIRERVRSEDWNTLCKGYPVIKSEDVCGNLGKPVPPTKEEKEILKYVRNYKLVK